MTLQRVLDNLRLSPEFMANITAWERIPARPASYTEFPKGLDPRLAALSRSRGYSGLYTHQADAVEAALSGKNVVVATGTASGKSLAYHLTALHMLLEAPGSHALYLFPTKALAQDQATSLRAFLDASIVEDSIPINIYDGDTPQSQRPSIRRTGGIIISNPDMLHMGILPYHIQWASFFANLRLVVLDELHSYRGIFGSHMSNVLRRLRRICRFHGSDPLFLCTSATIANPIGLAEKLVEDNFVLVENDGSPVGERHVILYNPPVLNSQLGIRKSYTLEAASLAGHFLTNDIQTIVFGRARLTTEILLGYIRDSVRNAGKASANIRGYRGGYLALERRAIEHGLRDGEILGVVATNALELGVDIGGLDGAILAGYPGTIASTWQQLGRAGRRASIAAGILVGSAAPLDQYILTHPRFLFERSPEQALINPDNLAILINHLRCAVFELPFVEGEGFGTVENTSDLLHILVDEGEVASLKQSYRWIAGGYPASSISLRTGTSDTVVIQDSTSGAPQLIGEVDRESAPRLVYEGAVYLHEGSQFIIEKLDWEQGIATAKQANVDYHTFAGTSTDIQVEEEQVSEVAGDCLKSYGRVLVTSQVTSYRIIKRYTHETIGYGDVSLPPQQFETTAYWISLTPDLTVQLEASHVLLRPNDYGPNWQEQRTKARARDQYRCTNCNAPEREERQHDVHHIRPFREFGYVLGENDRYLDANHLENLVTLCSNCHRLAEEGVQVSSGLSGMSNVLRNVATVLLMCAPNDIGIVIESRSTRSKTPTITIYDHAPGGLGLSLRLYEIHAQVLAECLETIKNCPCTEGCPACVGPEGEAGAMTKALTTRLLEAMIETPANP